MKTDHEHVWAVSRWHAGIGCVVLGCDAPYADWAQDEIRSLRAELALIRRASSNPHPARCECADCNELFGPVQTP